MSDTVLWKFAITESRISHLDYATRQGLLDNLDDVVAQVLLDYGLISSDDE